MPISTGRFRGPGSVRTTVYSCYTTRNLRIPRAGTTAAHVILRSLTTGCTRTAARLGTVLPAPVGGLRVVNNNSRGGLLGHLARRTLNIPIRTKPVRTATVNGVLYRTLTGNRIRSITRVHGVRVWTGRVGRSVLSGSNIDCIMPFVLVASYFTL